jgi:hypothetical protein
LIWLRKLGQSGGNRLIKIGYLLFEAFEAASVHNRSTTCHREHTLEDGFG